MRIFDPVLYRNLLDDVLARLVVDVCLAGAAAEAAIKRLHSIRLTTSLPLGERSPFSAVIILLRLRLQLSKAG